MKRSRLAGTSTIALVCLMLLMASSGLGLAAAQTNSPPIPGGTASSTTGPQYTMEATLSDQAQETTIAFDGLAFLSGSLGADSFFPPGKVADYWGFQYLRDNDPSAMGHNTDFLTKASLNMLTVLTSSQHAQLVTLANKQVARSTSTPTSASS